MDISSGCGYPASSLSNFAPHPFTFDGVEINSMEGFLQSLKFENQDMQKYVCTLVGLKAKYKGKRKRWYSSQTLYWKGNPFQRSSDYYQKLLDDVYTAMYTQSTSFRNALNATKNATLTHSIGKNKQNETVLTEKEFIQRLTKLRNT